MIKIKFDKINEIGKTIPTPLGIGSCERADLVEGVEIGKIDLKYFKKINVRITKVRPLMKNPSKMLWLSIII